MTEAEWLESTRPAAMLRWIVARQPDHRRQRLLLCAAFRSVWSFLTDERLRKAVLVYERRIEETVDEVTVVLAESRASSARFDRRSFTESDASIADDHLAVAVVALAGREAPWTILDTIAHGTVENSARLDAWGSVKAQHAGLIREVYGNPFRPVELDPAWLDWRDGTVAKLARAVYEERDLPSGALEAARLAILADALEEAGCTTEDLLSHLRGPGPHVRGCWALDLLFHGRA